MDLVLLGKLLGHAFAALVLLTLIACVLPGLNGS